MIRDNFQQRRTPAADEGYSCDASMSLAVKETELPHTLAPNVESSDFYMFVALLFGYKTAPLLWSRVAALLSRLLQSLVQGGEGQYQTYLDDGRAHSKPVTAWVGVRFALTEDAIILGLPDNLLKYLIEVLKSWENKGLL